MKNLLLVTVLILCSLSSNSQNPTPSIMRIEEKKNPGIAMAISAIVPGSGIAYNDKPLLGLAVFFTEAGLIYHSSKYSSREYKASTRNAATATGIAAGILYVAQLIYAPLDSKHQNKKNGYTTSIQVKDGGVSYCINF